MKNKWYFFSYLLAGITTSGVLLLGASELNTLHRSSMPASRVNNNTNSIISGNAHDADNFGKQPLGTVSLEDLGIRDGWKQSYHHSLEVITIAEDPEYWEIEQFDGHYYRVRREDHDPDFNGLYEFDTEEPIGDLVDLYNYAKSHKIISR